jgi:ankyrin repeat protein
MIKILLNAHPDILEMQDAQGNTPLMEATKSRQPLAL